MHKAMLAANSAPLARVDPPGRSGSNAQAFDRKTANVRGLRLQSGLLLCLVVCGCPSLARRPSVVGPYWDLVAVEPAEPSAYPLVVSGHARRCVRFTSDSVYSYANATEREVVDIAPYTGDYLYSYRFTQRNDSLFFQRRAYRIEYLSSDSLILRSGPHRSVYTAAREQQKIRRPLRR